MTFLKASTLVFFLWTKCAMWAADGSTANAAAGGPGRVVVLGDSITAGYGLDPTSAYPALLQQKIDAAGLPFTVVNAGVSGDTTAGGLRRVDWALRPGAALLLVALGANDGLRGTPPKETEANLSAIVQRARAKVPGIAVIIAGMQMPGSMGRSFVEQYAALFPRVAAESQAVLVPFLLEGVSGIPAMNQPDQIHPTSEGQKRIAATLWPFVQKVLVAAAGR